MFVDRERERPLDAYAEEAVKICLPFVPKFPILMGFKVKLIWIGKTTVLQMVVFLLEPLHALPEASDLMKPSKSRKEKWRMRERTPPKAFWSTECETMVKCSEVTKVTRG
jgi:hypothetical protein